MIRAYGLKNYSNKGKLEEVRKVFPWYRSTASAVAKDQWNYFYCHSRFNKFENFSKTGVKTRLSARYFQTIRAQVSGQLKSFVTNLSHKIKRIITKSSLSKEQKKKLYIINKYQFWYLAPFTSKAGIFYSEQDLKLSRKLFKQALRQNSKPSFNRINMVLDSKVCEIHKKSDTKSSSFDFWIRISTTRRGSPVWVPLNSNYYFKSRKGELKAITQINANRKGNLEFKLVKDIPMESYEPLQEVISLDLGFKDSFLHDCHGGHFGAQFLTKLKHYIEEINRLKQARGTIGLKDWSPRLDRINDKTRSLIKNEVNRIVNRIIQVHKPEKIVVEDLDFRGSKIGKSWNRLMSNYGQNTLMKKLDSVQDLLGIEIIKVNPAYTSQECSGCGYIDKKNRDSDEFWCCACGLKLQADTNASRVIKNRSSILGLGVSFMSRKEILSVLVKKFLDQNWERFSAFTGRNPRPNSWAGVFERNPYFSQELKLLG